MAKIKIIKNSFKFFLYCYLLFAICYLLTGCATVPTKEALPIYNINGINYLSLVALCQPRGINWDYDTFSKTATLSKDAHKINLMIGQTLVLVDGLPQHLKHRVDFYQGMLVVPYKFKEQVLDVLPPLSLLKIKTIVIDPGHGGFDPGTIGRTGLKEKYINLDIANRLAKLLRNDSINVIMTRSSDNFISLQRRAQIANEAKADLFVSIHTNANRVRGLNGFEVYYISANVNDSDRALATARDVSLELDKSNFDHLTLDLKATLWDMIYTNNRAESIGLAQAICRTVNRDLNTRILGIKGAGFYVLKGVRMPAVLIEVGFLSNSNEEQLLKNSYYRQEIAEATAQGIRNYAKEYRLAEASP